MKATPEQERILHAATRASAETIARAVAVAGFKLRDCSIHVSITIGEFTTQQCNSTDIPRYLRWIADQVGGGATLRHTSKWEPES